MEQVVETIRVTDANGDELTVFEYQEFVTHLASFELRRNPGRKRFVLDTGEILTRVDEDTFLIPATGERLLRIR